MVYLSASEILVTLTSDDLQGHSIAKNTITLPSLSISIHCYIQHFESFSPQSIWPLNFEDLLWMNWQKKNE